MTAGIDKTNFPPGTLEPTAAAASIRSFFLEGRAGKLEALLNEGLSDAPFTSVVCHPHPLGGGTMHNKVVYHAMKVLSALGWPVLRFNFRGTGLSEGTHDGGAEVADVVAALDWLSQEYGKPIVAAGFSFGAAMGLKACFGDDRIHGFAALGLPTHAEGRDYAYPFFGQLNFPTLFLSGDHDQYAPREQLRTVTRQAAEPSRLELISGAEHFFTGQLPAMQAALESWLRSTILTSNQTVESSARIHERSTP